MRRTLLALGVLATLCTLPVSADPAADLKAGSDIFANNCAQCHGDEGKGNGPQARFLDPKPADLTVATYKHGDSDDQLTANIGAGIPGTSMNGFGKVLDANELKAVVAYVKSLKKH